jgi:hypothetical protein
MLMGRSGGGVFRRTWASLPLTVLSAALVLQERASDRTIDAATRLEVIEGVVKHVKERYAYPEAAAAMEEALRERLRKGEYDSVTSGARLAQLLTAHLQAVREDPHLRVEFTAEPGTSSSPTANAVQTEEEQRKQREHWMRNGAERNFFVDRAERLPGNVGYLKLSAFFFVDMTRETLAAAMNLVAYTDALVVDLRHCGGGDVATAELLQHYFLEDADANVLGKRYLDRPVYLLTSRDIYSAPEAVARALQARGRAIVIGEPTRGATNVTAGFPINRWFSVSVPYTRSTDGAGADLSRQGVAPDIESSAEQAPDIAHATALEDLPAEAGDDELARERAQAAAVLRARLEKSRAR